jgi:hypothetical protein
MTKTSLIILVLIAILFAGCTSNQINPQDQIKEYKTQAQSEKLHAAIAEFYKTIENANTNSIIDSQITSKKAELATETDQNKKLEKQKEIFLLETQKEANNQANEIITWLKNEFLAAGTDLNSATTIQQVDEANAKAISTKAISMAANFEFAYSTLAMQQKTMAIDKNNFDNEQKTFQNFEDTFQAAKALQNNDFKELHYLCDLNTSQDNSQFDETEKQTIERQKETIKNQCTRYLEKYFIQIKSNYSSAPSQTKKKIAAAYSLISLNRPNNTNPDSNAPSQGQDDCNEKTDTLQRDACYQQKALEENNPELCNKLKVISKDECISKIAETQKNFGLCKKIFSEEMQNSCYYTIGIANLDAQACASIIQSNQDTIQKRDSCLNTIATTKTDANTCAMISASYSADQYARDNCYWTIFTITKDPSICQKFISKTEKEKCVSTMLSTPTTLEDCMQITLDTNRNACIEQIAVIDKNYLLCKQISDSNSKRTCLNKLANLFDSNSNETTCNEMTFTQDKDNCENKLAEATGKAQYCEKINNTFLQNQCYSTIGIKNNDASICEKILETDSEKWDDCFESIARTNNDASLCLKIKNQSTMIDCIFNTAINLQSMETCAIFNPRYIYNYSKYPLEELCYKNYAITKNNLFLCNQIQEKKLSDACWDQNTTFK